MLVHQILNSKGDSGVITVKPDAKVSEVTHLLAERRIGGVVVSSDGKAVEGILSERDIVRSLALKGPSCLDEEAREMMTRNPSCCAPGDQADNILQRMTYGRFRHMPVTQDKQLICIVTIGDVVKARLQELAMEKDALEGMIMGH